MLFDAPDGPRVSDANHDVRIAEMKRSKPTIRETAGAACVKATIRTSPHDVTFYRSSRALSRYDTALVLVCFSPRPIGIFQRELRQLPRAWRLMRRIPTQAELQQKSAKMTDTEVATLGINSTLLQEL